MTAAILETRDTTIRFGGLTAVNKVCVSVQPGQVFSIIGPNGAGKTTLFNAITGIYEPTHGTVLVGGREVIEPLRPWTIAGILAIGVLTSVGVVLAFNIVTLWERCITALYVYQEPFPWGRAASELATVLSELPPSQGAWPAIAGFLFGAVGSWSVWSRSRRAPEIVCEAGVARTFQNIRLFPQMTVRENVLVGMDRILHEGALAAALRLRRHRRTEARAAEDAAKILAFVGLAAEADLRASELSYGHQRRLEIGRALASRPSILLLDEPAAGLNPSEADDLVDLIRRIRERGITVILIEHHMRVVMGVSDRIAVLDYGNKIAEGTPEEIRCNPKVIEAYLGQGED